MKKFNVIMLLLDGLRSDRLYLCPNLSNILKKAYFFPNMVTAAPYTIASLHAVFSGIYPTKNGVNSYFHAAKFKKDVCKTLTQYFHDDGYYTTANIIVDSVIPPQGFDSISIHNEYKDDLVKLHKSIITDAAKKNKFFLFLHYTNIHTENIKNVAKKYTDFDEEYFKNYELNKNNYNSYLKKMDIYVKEIFDHIKNSGLLGNTILVIFSDHGTSNGEKIGERMYGSFTYDYTIKVFCSFLVPNTKGREIKFQTRTNDIMPTLLDISSIDVDDSYEHLQGSSLLPLMEGKEKKDRIAFSETGGLYGPWPSHYEHNVFCVRTPNTKLIFNKTPNTWEMYDLDKDPQEKMNIYKENNQLAVKLKKILLEHIKSNQSQFKLQV